MLYFTFVVVYLDVLFIEVMPPSSLLAGSFITQDTMIVTAVGHEYSNLLALSLSFGASRDSRPKAASSISSVGLRPLQFASHFTGPSVLRPRTDGSKANNP
jgi:hypothetical protein